MTAQLINGKDLSQQIRKSIKDKASKLTKEYRQPCLAVILVGEDPASQVYVRNKVKSCGDCGIKSILHRLPADSTEKEVIDLINTLNQDKEVDGILVQLPLPKHISEQKSSKQSMLRKTLTASIFITSAHYLAAFRV